MRVIYGFLALLLFSFQPTLAKTTKTEIPSAIKSSEFNSVSSTYMKRPTFVTLNTRTKGKSWLDISMDRYGGRLSTNSFTQDGCDQYLAYIEKYFEWEKLALQDGDIINKKIGKAKNISLGISFYFVSGNENNHYLSIGYSQEYSQFFDHDEVIKLKDLLIRYKNGELKPIDVDKKYQ